jgi:dihydrofolate reductase
MEHTRALLFGRRTWQLMAGAWPGRAGDPFADQMNSIDKYVLSRSQLPGDVTWTNSHLVGGDDPFAEVAKLRESGDGFLQVMGSLSVAQELIKRDLVDEYRLMVEPITLGGGKRLFPDDGQARTLQLVSSTVASTGVLICTYRPVGS